MLLLIKNASLCFLPSGTRSRPRQEQTASGNNAAVRNVFSFLFFPSTGAQLAARDNIVRAAELRHFTDSQSWAVGVCDWVGVARCVCVCVIGVLRFAELVFLCDSRKCSVSDVRVGNGGHRGFQDVVFFHSRWIFVTLPTFPPCI